MDPQFYRPAEVDLLLADPTKARTKLGWEPEVSFAQLVHMMVDADLALLGGDAGQGDRACRGNGERMRREG